MTMPLSPAPIIRAPRIPLELQRVFLASNRGETVNIAPKNAFQVFPRNKSKSIHMRRVKSCEDFSSLHTSFSGNDELSDDEERRRTRRGRRMLQFAEGEAKHEFDQRKPVIRCSMMTDMSKKAMDDLLGSPARSTDDETESSESLVRLLPEKPALRLPMVDTSRWNLIREEKKIYLDSRPSLPTRKHTRRASVDCAPSFPVRRKSETRTQPFPRRSSIDSIPRLPRRTEAELCAAS